MSFEFVRELQLDNFVLPAYTLGKDSVSLYADIQAKNRGIILKNTKGSSDPFTNWWQSFLSNGTGLSEIEGSKNSLRYVDLFSSVGGLSLSLNIAAKAFGLFPSALLAVDLDKAALEVYRKNFNPMLTINQSLSGLVDFQITGKAYDAEFNFEPKLIPSSIHDLKGEVDIVLAGPPCQGHSTLNNHTRGDDKRNFLYVDTAAFISAIKPKAFVIENVPNVINDKSRVVPTAKALLRKQGYALSEAIISANEIGWAQTRKRHFLIGVLDQSIMDLGILIKKESRLAMPSSAILKRSSFVPSDPEIMHSNPHLSRENVERINWLFENNAFELPNSKRPDCHKDGHTYPSVYGRIRPDEPAPTLTTGFMSPGRGRFIHPFERRTLQPREAARIQGFPDTFMFEAKVQKLTRNMLAKWIGDAVPSPLGFLPSFAVISSIFK